MAGCFGHIPARGLCLLQEEDNQEKDDGPAGKRSGPCGPPVLAVDTLSLLTLSFWALFHFIVPLYLVSG